jgi:hypothetical protein
LPARCCLFLFLAFFGFRLFAADLQTWHELDYQLLRAGRFQWNLLGRLRFAETVGDLYDRRAGTMVEYGLGNGVSVSGGYLYRNRRDGNSFVNENRLFAGISYPILRRQVVVEGSSLYERHVVPGSDFHRYKQAFEAFQSDKALSPWIYQQFTFKQGEGFVRSRSRLGVRWKRSSYVLKAAYQFESLETGRAWTPRHAIYTELSIERPIWKFE